MIPIFKIPGKPLLLSLILSAGLLFNSAAAIANTVRIFSLNAELWARPRAGAVIPRMEAVRLAVEYWETGRDYVLLLSYPGEDSGEIWAAELKDWLISLGVPSDYILLSAGLQAQDEVRILVGNRQEIVK